MRKSIFALGLVVPALGGYSLHAAREDRTPLYGASTKTCGRWVEAREDAHAPAGCRVVKKGASCRLATLAKEPRPDAGQTSLPSKQSGPFDSLEPS